MNVLTTLFAVLLLSGCVSLEKFWDKEFLEVYAPAKLREKEQRYMAENLDYWLGKPKKERVRVIGAPNKCSALNAAEEVCEWAHRTDQLVTFTYDRDGLARAWAYQGMLGQFTSADYRAGKSTPVSSSQAGLQQEKKWVHSTKAETEYSPDYFQCQTDVQRDPQAGVMGAGSTLLLQTAIRKCMEQKGWVER